MKRFVKNSAQLTRATAPSRNALTASLLRRSFLLVLLGFGCALWPTARAVNPPADGAYPGIRAAGDEAAQDPTPTPTPVAIYETNFKANNVQAFTLTGTGLGVFATPLQPTGIVMDGTGNVYVSSDKPGGYAIDKYLPDGSFSVFATSGLKGPHALVFDKAGNLYVSNAVADTIEMFTPDGVGSVFADANDGLINPVDLVFDASGNLFVTNAYGGPLGTGSVEMIAPDGTATVFADTGFSTAYGLAIDSAGNIYVSNFAGNTVEEFAPDGTDLGIFVSSPLNGPHGMVFDGDGNLYVANNATNTIEKFSSTGAYLGVFANTGLGPHFLAMAAQTPVPTPTPTPAPPMITTQPANRIVRVGQTATFAVVASGTDLGYQWRKNGVNIARATKASYTTPATTLGDSGSLFSVIVKNTYGSVTSDDAKLTVKTSSSIGAQPSASGSGGIFKTSPENSRIAFLPLDPTARWSNPGF